MGQYPGFNDTDLLQKGEAQTEYNDNASTIFRLDLLKRQANFARTIYTIEGLYIHLSAVKGMEMELAGKLNQKEQEDLEKVKINDIMAGHQKSPAYVYSWKRRLEQYEEKVRMYLQHKGLGVTAKKDDDPRKAILK